MSVTQRVHVEDAEVGLRVDAESEELNIRVFLEDSDTQVRVDAESEELNIRVFVEGDEGVNISISGGDVLIDDYLVVIKNFRLGGVTGSAVVDITGWHKKFKIQSIVWTKISGSPSTVKAGWSAGSDEVSWETDVSMLQTGIPLNQSVEMIPPPDEETLSIYFTIPDAVYTIDLILVRYKL